MADHRKRDSLFWGILLIAAGVIFLLEKLDVHAWDYVWKFWPVILIVWGASKLLAGLQEKQEKPGGDKPASPPQA
jgi:uncharacterized membrane protein HdeD (DUF308 family)